MGENSDDKKRELDILVLSDIHLGTYGCHAKELSKYLKSVQPKMVVLNGDIIDFWQMSSSYWPKSHSKIIKIFSNWLSKDIPVYYITGNHDETIRRFAGFELGTLKIENKLMYEFEGKKFWFFHGDVFDVTMQYAKWLTRLGSTGYNLLILINRFVNYILEKFGRGRISFSKNVKNKVKNAVSYINKFEELCVELAAEKNIDYVICGHIHHPSIKTFFAHDKLTTYLNSGDWVENLTSLEYNNNEWEIYKYDESEFIKSDKEEFFQNDEADDELIDLNNKQIFSLMIKEIREK